MEKPNYKLSGFSKVENGKNVHLLVEDIYTICSINTKEKKTGIPDEQLKLTDVNCAKCKRTQFYKDLLNPVETKTEKETKKKEVIDKIIDKPKDTKPPKKDQTKDHKEKVEKVKKIKQEQLEIPEPLESKKPESESKEIKTDKSESNENCSTKEIEKVQNEIKQMLDGNDKTIPYKEINTKCIRVIESIQGQFIAKQRSDFRFRILHKPTGRPFFDGINESLVIQSLVFLNNIELEWNGINCIPKEFISECREAMKNAYVISGKKYPESLTEKAREHKLQAGKKNKNKIVLRRRQKNNVIQLRRREKPVIKLRRREKIVIKRRIKA